MQIYEEDKEQTNLFVSLSDIQNATTMKNITPWKVILLSVMLSACGRSMEKEHEAAKAVAEGFSEAFFNMDFDRAASYSAPESYIWIRFKASNITKKDLEVYNREQRTAESELDDLTFLNDTTATAICNMSHVLLTDSLERQATMAQEKSFIIPLVKRDGQWLVKMEGPLQSAK